MRTNERTSLYAPCCYAPSMIFLPLELNRPPYFRRIASSSCGMGESWEGTYGDAYTQFCASCSAIHSPYHLSSADGSAPRAFRGKEVYDMVKDINVVLGKGRKLRTRQKNIWKKRSIFWDLPYWEHLEVRHCIDVMHVEKNVCDSLIDVPSQGQHRYP